MRKRPPTIPDRVITVISDVVVMEVACDDERFEDVLVALQKFLLTLDVNLALMTMQSGADVFAEHDEAEQVRRAAMRN